jgi:hypothetical protein
LAAAQGATSVIEALRADGPENRLTEPGRAAPKTAAWRRGAVVAAVAAIIAITAVLLREKPAPSPGEAPGDAPAVVVTPKTFPGPADWPGFDDWVKEVAAMPAEEKAAAVAGRLKARNPDFTGEVTPKYKDGVLNELLIRPVAVADLWPVRALPELRVLRCGTYETDGRLTDLSPLRGLAIETLEVPSNPKLTDLSPLRDVPSLRKLSLEYTAVADLTPLSGSKVEILNVSSTPVSTLAPLQGLPLKQLYFTFTAVNDMAPLRGMPLIALDCMGTRVTDLAPLRDSPLQWLKCAGAAVEDLTPLTGKRMVFLQYRRTRVRDVSVLAGMPLLEVECDYDPARDAAVLRSIRTLKKINGRPAADVLAGK